VPKLVKQFDLLLLPIDFDKAGIKFAKYSMPTKMTEYMVSGIPSLIFAPEVCAVTNYAIKNNVAFTCTDENEQVVVETIKRIIYNIEERENISKKAIIYAKKNHNIENERLRFKSLIYKCLTNFKHE
jgi:glycosyltransferase involved in cell wall biosynthesis